MTERFSTTRLQRLAEMAELEVQNQRIAGCALAVGTAGESKFQYCCGHAQIESGVLVDSNTVFRIASMTKPITSLAVMMLYERGTFLLDDPIENYLSEFADMQVLTGESTTRAANSSITIRHLLTHTSGIGYSFSHPQLGKRYRQANIRDWGYQDGTVIQEVVERLAAQPLAFDPGQQWLYGLNSDVLGRFVEVVSGLSFAEFLQHEIFDPLGMDSTRFYPNALQQQRLATVYTPDISKDIYDNIDFLSAKESFPVADNSGLRELSALEFEPFIQADFAVVQAPSQAEKVYYSGGAGLHSTLEDYSRFCQMMIGEGELRGERLVSRTTIELMRSNNIGELTINLGGAIDSDQFGLGFAVIQDVSVQPFLSTTGVFYWGGAYNTRFILDPVNQIYAISLTQLYPNFHCDWNNRMIGLVYQALS